MYIVHKRWKQAMSCPKMRQFKQLDAYLFIYGNNTFFDGIKVEFLHKFLKKLQKDQNNYKKTYKTMVTLSQTKQLSKRYALNGGKWGPNFEYQLGRLCRRLKSPKDHSKPNLVLINYLIPSSIIQNEKVHVTKTLGKEAVPSAISQLTQRPKRDELLMYINSQCDKYNWKNNRVTWYSLINDGTWTISKITNFRFHCHDSSFSMNLMDDHKCIMKTRNGYVMQFTHAYQFSYLDYKPFCLAYGTFWKINVAAKPYDWIDDKFASMDFIYKTGKRENGWYFMEYLVEPVFLIHDCVSFDDIKRYLSIDWQRKGSDKAFYRDFTFNMHQLMLEQDEPQYKQGSSQQIHLPCGPVFQCKAHKRSRCRQCIVDYMVFTQSHWEPKWKCNVDYHKKFFIFDAKNGLDMTLMKTVVSKNEYKY